MIQDVSSPSTGASSTIVSTRQNCRSASGAVADARGRCPSRRPAAPRRRSSSPARRSRTRCRCSSRRATPRRPVGVARPDAARQPQSRSRWRPAPPLRRRAPRTIGHHRPERLLPGHRHVGPARRRAASARRSARADPSAACPPATSRAPAADRRLHLALDVLHLRAARSWRRRRPPPRRRWPASDALAQAGHLRPGTARRTPRPPAPPPARARGGCRPGRCWRTSPRPPRGPRPAGRRPPAR